MITTIVRFRSVCDFKLITSLRCVEWACETSQVSAEIDINNGSICVIRALICNRKKETARGRTWLDFNST